MPQFLTQQIPTPCYVVDETLLKRNLEILSRVERQADCKILLALKGFSMHAVFPLVGEYLSGITASSLFEARLGAEKMGKQVHIYAPAYPEQEMDELLTYVDHMVFNSFAQWKKYRQQIANYPRHIECGLRVNPEYSEIATDLYNPCIRGSRLGILRQHFEEGELQGISGLHFHTHCEQNSDALWRTLPHLHEKFGDIIPKMKWLNMGGGHHITRPDYDIDLLIRCIKTVQDRYGVAVYLEPGEAIALNTGFLVSKVLDIVENGMPIAILDTSAACHMPDVIEMPYRPNIVGAGKADEKPYTYRLGGMTCLAGDIIGDYSFDAPLAIGDHLVFEDMAHYTMVKNHMFNGVNLPAIALHTLHGQTRILRQFGFEDYAGRLS